jgi:hypothetical protein
MATPYSIIFNKFYKRLVNDKQFFNYSGLTEDQIKTLVQDHTLDLLEQAIEAFYKIGNPVIDFYDKDDNAQQFNVDLVKQEISLIVDLMYQKYFDEDKNKLHAFGLIFTSNELNVVASPANDRKTFLEMIKNIDKNNLNALSDYFCRDRKTWQRKSIYES